MKTLPAKYLPLLLALVCGQPVFAAPAEPSSVSAAELPRITPLEPEQALTSFAVKPGFKLELAAAEPLVLDPVALGFDEAGRLFVVEMRDYSERRQDRLGRIRMLTDTNHDGRYDRSTVYADGLGWPTAVICYDGGLFVGCTPDILWFKDTDGDGVADERNVVFTGFGAGQERLNVQGMINSFQWGLDNRIHGATGLNGGRIKARAAPEVAPVELRGKDFSFDPRDLRSLRPESGGGQHGLSFDNAGRKFVCHNSRHIVQVMYEDHYTGANPHYSLPPPLVDIAVDGPAAEVFRLSPEEPWRVLRTRWRVAGKVSGPIEGGGRASGYFTSATGITIYRGDAFPREYVGDAFIADVGSNLIHHKKLRASGVALVAERSPDEQTSEFIASRDLWFRPVQFANGPDGALYMADMYREVVEHPWSIPESIKKHLDLNSGNDRGRIYRIVPEHFERRPSPAFKDFSTAQLVAGLEHPNGWHRDTAARLLYQRQDPTAALPLRRLLGSSPHAHARLHALYVLLGLGVLQSQDVKVGWRDSDSVVRAHAVRLSEPRFLPNEQDVWRRNFGWARRDATALVRYQAAFTMGERNPSAEEIAEVARVQPSDPWIEAALLRSVSSQAASLFLALVHGPPDSSPSSDFMRHLGQLVGRQDHDSVLAVADALAKVKDAARACGFAAALLQGLPGKDLAAVRVRLNRTFERARSLATSADAAEADRTAAIALLAFDTNAPLLGLLGPEQPPAVQLAALSALDHRDERLLAKAVLERWPAFSPRLRHESLSLLLKRPGRARELLASIESGVVQPAELSSTQRNFFRSHRDPAIRAWAGRVLPVPSARREDIVQSLLPAVTMTGEVARGKAIYLERCSSCHRLAGQGHPLGPDLETVRTTGKEKLLINIVDPNREVPSNYLAYLVETKTGESFLGLVANETAASVMVRQAYGKEDTVPRSQISKVQSQGQSLMPEGLEAGLNVQDMADLLEYLAPN